MARINGISLKSVKFIKLDEKKRHYGFTAGLYVDNKKVAVCSCLEINKTPTIEWCKDICIDDKVDKYISNYNKDISVFSKIDILLNDLLELSDFEKEYKSMIKKGANVLIAFNSAKKGDCIVGFETWNDDIETRFKNKYKPTEYKVFKSLDDFIIE